jgi:hypothetical protein
MLVMEITLLIDGHDPLKGRIRRGDRDWSVFEGWVDLLRLLGQLTGALEDAGARQ